MDEITTISAVTYGITHRKTNILEYIQINRRLILNSINVMIAKLEMDNNWWVIPNSIDGDKRMDDLGPFDTWEHCLVFIKLSE